MKLLSTGASKYANKMNIYDFAGNAAEWTLEKNTYDYGNRIALLSTFRACANFEDITAWKRNDATFRDDKKYTSYTIAARASLY